MQLTTQQVIKTIPFEENFKQELIEKLPTLPKETQLDVVTMIWNLYYSMYDMKFDENTDAALTNAANNQESLDPNFYKRVHDKTIHQMEENVTKTTTQVDLSTTRQKLQEILQSTPQNTNPTE